MNSDSWAQPKYGLASLIPEFDLLSRPAHHTENLPFRVVPKFFLPQWTSLHHRLQESFVCSGQPGKAVVCSLCLHASSVKSCCLAAGSMCSPGTPGKRVCQDGRLLPGRLRVKLDISSIHFDGGPYKRLRASAEDVEFDNFRVPNRYVDEECGPCGNWA